MAGNFILSIDQGTTGTTVLIVDLANPRKASVVGRATVDFKQHYPQAGWVEHDLEEIWTSVCQAARSALAQATSKLSHFSAQDIAAIGITNQRETLCCFDRRTGAPLARAIVWQCRRSIEICERLKQEGWEKEFKAKTGLVLDPYFSGTKMTWLLEHQPTVAAAVREGKAAFGTIDTFLIHRLTAGKALVTEASNASRTLLYNIVEGRWDPNLLQALSIPNVDALPEVRDSAGLFGSTRGLSFLRDGIPITGALGDQQAALAGQACFKVGEAKCTYGTGAFFLLNLGHQPLASQAGMLTTVAWSVAGQRTYAFEGSAFIAGAAVQFMRDQLGFIATAAESQKLAENSVGAPEVYFVPSLVGLGAPYWDPNVRGAVFGLTRGTTRGQIMRATLEGIALQVRDLIVAMKRDFGGDVSVLRVDGGAAANDLLMQIQSNLSDIPVDRPANIETTAFGAAMFAGLGAGIFKSLDDVSGVRRTEKIFSPDQTPASRQLACAQIAGWQRAIDAAKVFAGSGKSATIT